MIVLLVTALIGGLAIFAVSSSRARARQEAAAKRAVEEEAAKSEHERQQAAFRATIESFAYEVRSLLGRMDAGLSYSEYTSKIGDLAAAYANIDRAERIGLNGMILDAAEDAYEAFKDVREPWLEKIRFSDLKYEKDLRDEQFNKAFSTAAEKAQIFLLLYEPKKR